jgi:hypothetical protein
MIGWSAWSGASPVRSGRQGCIESGPVRISKIRTGRTTGGPDQMRILNIAWPPFDFYRRTIHG